MGAQFCSPGHAEVMMSFTPNELDGLATLDLKSSYPSGGNALDVEMLTGPVASACFLPMSDLLDHFELQDATMQECLNFCTAVHRKTGAVRRLHSVRKPRRGELQEQLKAHVLRLQDEKCEGLVRILEIYEDVRSIGLITEQCSGGTVYDRILQRHYFAEQESAVLVRHMLQAIHSLHCAGLAHGLLSPDSFRFQSDHTSAPLKVVDFGLELKLRLAEPPSGPRSDDQPHSACIQLFQACHIVFCAPEIFRQLDATKAEPVKGPKIPLVSSGAGRAKPARGSALDFGLLSEQTLHSRADAEDFGLQGFLARADVWSVGAIAFLLLCGYPPFFAPCRQNVLSRIEKIDFSFDPPFWSKISEEAKDFVQKCMQGSPNLRFSVTDALQHPWIQSLADTSPCGSMLASFAVNLRRFYRTSFIEACAASSLASKLSYRASFELQQQCKNADTAQSGFLTSSDLRQVLHNLGHNDVAEAIGACFARSLRQPGESYLDYNAIADCIRLRREQLLEGEIWEEFRSFDSSLSAESSFPFLKLVAFLEVPAIKSMPEREGAKAGVFFSPGSLDGRGKSDFVGLVTELLRQLRSAVRSAAPAAATCAGEVAAKPL
eukprot:TRINITY_DN108779_c0_g1_i1.p1 TRINITY_DN108779_c0_g1~~TRINITY_DN108779_c0_g1_i1.p1  ORF type:complete len:604 (-),score=97.19 TRINITY_DN108779_c0_g1_i1:21-1832(-)